MNRLRLPLIALFCLSLMLTLWGGVGGGILAGNILADNHWFSPPAHAQAEWSTEPSAPGQSSPGQSSPGQSPTGQSSPGESSPGQSTEISNGVRSLSLAELPSLGIAPQMTALIPPNLRQSNHPQNRRGIIGGDERVELLSRSYPWSAIGLILSYGDDATRTCSGTLVATDVVLTNAHCVLDVETGVVYANIVFAPNVINNTVVSTEDITEVESVFYGPDFLENPSAPHPDDWAFMKLKQPLGDRYGTLPWRILPPDQLVNDYAGAINLVGYSGDFPDNNPGATAGVHLGCSVIDVYEESLAHNCDTFGGSSGGPLLAWIDRRPYIVGVNSAERVRLLEESDAPDDALDDAPEQVGIVNYGVQIPRIANFLHTYL